MGLNIIRDFQQWKQQLILKSREEQKAKLMRRMQELDQQAADELEAVTLKCAAVRKALEQLKTAGVPAVAADEVTQRFIQLQNLPESEWADAFALDLAELGFVSSLTTAAHYRRSRAAMQISGAGSSLVDDICQCLLTQRQLDQPLPEQAQTEALLARALLKEEKWMKVEMWAHSALLHAEGNPEVQAQAYLALGSVSRQMKNQPKAVEFFREALAAQLLLRRFDGLTVEIYKNLGFAYEFTG